MLTMDTKLTLKLEQAVIEKAKVYAKRQKTSLSRLIENYLLNITDTDEAKEKITPLVRSLSGILDLPSDIDHNKEYSDYLANKYK
jgi:macrodomain Ter protein organizer (MatP/YcbG family)